MANWWKFTVSLLLIAHFIAILGGILAAPGPNQTAPALASAINQATSSYIDTLLLNCPFRFYAPNPGPTRLTWYRVERADGTAAWFEMPFFDVGQFRTVYQRGLAMSAFLDTQVGPDEQHTHRLALSPVGSICSSSFVRKLTRQLDSRENPVQSVQVFTVHHRVLEPNQIASGWSLYDLRLYRPCCLGMFLPDGRRANSTEGDEKYPTAIESSRLGARMCVDLAAGNADPLRSIGVHWPRAMRELVRAQPDLIALHADENELKSRIEKMVEPAPHRMAHTNLGDLSR